MRRWRRTSTWIGDHVMSAHGSKVYVVLPRLYHAFTSSCSESISSMDGEVWYHSLSVDGAGAGSVRHSNAVSVMCFSFYVYWWRRETAAVGSPEAPSSYICLSKFMLIYFCKPANEGALEWLCERGNFPTPYFCLSACVFCAKKWSHNFD